MGAPEELVTGSVVLINWPFSDLSGSKIRPAVVLAPLENGSSVLCQVTSQGYHKNAVMLKEDNFDSGGLLKTSFALPAHVFTADERILIKEVGRLNIVTIESISDQLKEQLDAGLTNRKRKR